MIVVWVLVLVLVLSLAPGPAPMPCLQIEHVAWPATLVDPPLPQSATRYPRLNGHRAAWITSIARGLRQPVHLLQCRHRGELRGMLPLHLVSGPLFGRFLISLPYLNTGGVWAEDDATARQLIDAACDLADALDVRYLELRHEQPVPHPRLNHQRTDKVHLRMPLPDSVDALRRSFKSKLRSQIKRASEQDLTVQFGGPELLDDFYGIFAHNMRDLGTPVFPKHLFRWILREFAQEAEVCTVTQQDRPIAGGLLVHGHGVTEVPSASSLRRWNHTGANMLMYWHLLQRAIERGSHQFDFGRSSEGSGTYRFKRQWGATPSPAVWQYYVRRGSPETMRPEDAGKQRLVKLWQQLPVWLTMRLGPLIVRGIP